MVVPTRDFDRAVDFYENTLGLKKSQRYGEHPGQEFETGTLTLAVMDLTGFGMEHPGPVPGIALRVGDVEAARGQLAEKGVEFFGETIDSGVCHQAFFADPDGNRLVLHQRYAPKSG